jgi:hypothetical protein
MENEKEVSTMRGCVVNGCLELSKYVPIVKVKLPDNDNPFALDFNQLAICQTHKDKFTIKDIITDKRLLDIQRLFMLSNLTQPRLEHMELTWQFDTFRTQIPLIDSLGNPLGNIPVINKEKGTKV